MATEIGDDDMFPPFRYTWAVPEKIVLSNYAHMSKYCT